MNLLSALPSSFRRRFISTLAVFCLAFSIGHAQLPLYAWSNTLDGLTSAYSLTNSSGIADITHDAAGNIYTVGDFYGSIDANPGTGTTTLAATSSGMKTYIIKSSPTGSLIWAKALQGSGTSSPNAMSVDASGNVYFVGRFSSTVDFDPGSGTFNLTSVSNNDMYMAKLDANGDFVWAKKISSASFISPSKMDLDPSGNPIYVGYFSGATDFNPNSGATTLTGTSNTFVLKLDASGNFVFAKYFSSTSLNAAEDVKVNANGDIFLSGRYTTTTDFDPGAGTTNLSVNSFSQDAYLCQLNSSGNLVWAKGFGGANSDQINAMDLDYAGNILVTGSFRNYVDFDPGTGGFVMQTSGSTLDDIFIAKYTSTGDFIWAKQIGNSSNNYTDENSNDIAVDPSGNVCVVGFYYDAVDFDPGNGNTTLSTSLNRNTFVVGLNSIGAFNYAFDFGMESVASSESESVDIDDNGNIFVGGYTDGICDMDPGMDVNTITAEYDQAFLLKLSAPSPEAYFTLPSYTGCSGKPMQLVSNNWSLQSAWQWSATGGTITNPNSANASITFPQSGFYTITLTVTSPLGTSNYNQTVSISNGPTITVSASPNMLCGANASTTLSATVSSGSLQWSSGQTASFITVYPTVTTTYTATVTASNGCTASASQLVEVVTQPNITITASDNSICNGETVTLTANGALYYNWSNGSSSQSITVSPSSTTSYSVTGTISTCSGTANQTIQVSNAPSISIQSTSNTVCNGASVTLTATGGSSYLWSTGQTTASITVSPSSTTTYTVTGTNAGGCSNSANKTITVGATPTINVSASNNTPCAGTSIVLTATGGTSYLWAGGQTTNAITVSPTINTTYTVTGTNAAGCQAIGTKVINVDPLPSVAIQSASTTICAGSSISLTANGADSYVWNGGQTSNTISVSPANTSTYTVTGTNSFNCQASATQTITVHPIPSLNIQSAGTSVCFGNSISLTVNGASTYSWNTGQTTNSISVSPFTTTTYSVTGTSAANCSSSATTTITVNPLPNVFLQTIDDTLCQGTSTQISATGASSYVWSSGETSSSITANPTSSTSYSVTGTSAEGCTNTANASIEVIPFPLVSFVDPISSICFSASATELTVTPQGGSFSGSGMSNGFFDPALAGLGTHTISYSYSTAECSALVTVEIMVDECLAIASSASTSTIQVFPNPANENVTIKGLNTPCDVRLFNQQGQLVWSAKSTQSSYVFPVNSFAAGIYVLNIQSQQTQTMHKIIISD